MTRSEFELFWSDPFEVRRALPRGLCNELLRNPSPHLERVQLWPLPEPPSMEREMVFSLGGTDMVRVTTVLSALLNGRRLILQGAPVEVLRLVFLSSPRCIRPLSASYGLKPSPSRPLQLVCINGERKELDRIVCDDDVQVLDWQSIPAPDHVLLHGWLGFVLRMWQLDRHEELRRFAAQMPNHTDLLMLNETITLCEDIERIGHANAEVVDVLLAKYVKTEPVVEAHRQLLDELCVTAELRRDSLASVQDTLRASNRG